MFKTTTFSPSEYIKTINSLVITLNGKPLIGMGEFEDNSSHVEAKKLLDTESFNLIVDGFYQFESDNLQIKKIHGSNISWKDEEVCLSTDSNNVHWVVFGDRANRLANAICSCKEIKDSLFENKSEDSVEEVKASIKKHNNR